MNRLIAICMFFTVILFVSCKKVEDKFPAGYYEIDATVRNVGSSDDIEVNFPVRLFNSSNSQLSVYHYTFDTSGDTVFGENSYLNVSNKKSVSGTIDRLLIGDEPVKLTDGQIKRESRNNYIIEGLIDYQIWFDGGDEYYWEYFTGTYVLRKKE